MVFRVLLFSFSPFQRARPSRTDVGDVRLGDPVIGGKGVFINDLAVVIAGGGQLAPVDIEGLLAIAHRHLIDEAIGIGIAVFALAAVDLECLDIAGGRQSRYPFIQRRVRIGLAHQDKIQPLPDEGFAQRLFAIQVITQDRHAQRPVSRPIVGQPTFGRDVLAILLLMAILGGDEFRLQGNHPRIARGHDHRCDGTVGIGDGAVFTVRDVALVTVDRG